MYMSFNPIFNLIEKGMESAMGGHNAEKTPTLILRLFLGFCNRIAFSLYIISFYYKYYTRLYTIGYILYSI